MSNNLEQEKKILAIEDAMLTVAQSHEFDKDDHPFKWLLLAPKRRNLRKLLNAELGTSNGCAAFLEAVKRLGVEATGRALRTFNGQNKGVPEFGKLAMESLELSQDFLNGLALSPQFFIHC